MPKNPPPARPIGRPEDALSLPPRGRDPCKLPYARVLHRVGRCIHKPPYVRPYVRTAMYTAARLRHRTHTYTHTCIQTRAMASQVKPNSYAGTPRKSGESSRIQRAWTRPSRTSSRCKTTLPRFLQSNTCDRPPSSCLSSGCRRSAPDNTPKGTHREVRGQPQTPRTSYHIARFYVCKT